MYVSYVYEVPEEYFLKNTNNFYTNIYLTSLSEQKNIMDFIFKFGIEEYKSVFDLVKIKYQSIAENGLSYTVKDGTNLLLGSLSSGERIMLYSMIMSKLNKPVIVLGLIDRLDKTHRDILVKNSDLFKTLIVLTYKRVGMNQDVIDAFHKPFDEILKEGII